MTGKRLNLVVVGYSLITESGSGSAITTLGMAKCTEKYSTLRDTFDGVTKDVASTTSIPVDDHEYNIEYFFGADLKFSNMVYGLDACNCTYACLWCLCSAKERSDFSKKWPLTGPKARTVEGISERAGLPKSHKEKHNCGRPPLLQFIPISNAVPDVLHMFLRISDNLLQKFVAELRRMDNVASNAGGFDPEIHKNLAKFRDFARNQARLHFDITRTATRKLDFTDLPLKQRVRLMRLCDVEMFLQDSGCDGKKVNWLWKEFIEIYELLSPVYWQDLDFDALQARITKWCNVYCHDVYQASAATPYVHIFYAHMVDFLKLHGPLGRFSQQRFENNNHIITQAYFRGTSYSPSSLEQILRREYRTLRFRSSSIQRVKRRYCCSDCHLPGHSRLSCPSASRLT